MAIEEGNIKYLIAIVVVLATVGAIISVVGTLVIIKLLFLI